MSNTNLMELTDDELITRYLICNAEVRIKKAQQTKHDAQERCKHRHVNIEHKRLDNDGHPEFYSNMRCLVCGKHWIEEGSK